MKLLETETTISRHATVEPGTIIRNKGGGYYGILRKLDDDTYRVQNKLSGWVCTIHVLTRYDFFNAFNDCIVTAYEWDYSTDGEFQPVAPWLR